MQQQFRIWLVATLAIAVLVTTGCSKTPDATTAAPKPTESISASASPSVSASPSPSASESPGTVSKGAAQAAQLFPNLPRLEGKATVVMMVKGSPVTIEVDGTNAPVTAGNFVDLVDKKVYDGLVFHRVVRQPQPFVVQGGDPDGRDPNVPVDQLGRGGYIDPATNQPRSIPLEIKPSQGDKIVYSKTFEEIRMQDPPKLRHTRGAVAMARSGFPDSASSQFYVALADLSFLDGNYAVFGYVTQGMDVVDKIQQGDRIESARVTSGLENLKNRK
ncbi:peptidylprolyl isomerase [Alkalinema sp. FACHB-956]|nr:peptidylprolyl isomerase [Alkalinema sp. FACHB-956]